MDTFDTTQQLVGVLRRDQPRWTHHTDASRAVVSMRPDPAGRPAVLTVSPTSSPWCEQISPPVRTSRVDWGVVSVPVLANTGTVR
jgi:hypothetical protein